MACYTHYEQHAIFMKEIYDYLILATPSAIAQS